MIAIPSHLARMQKPRVTGRDTGCVFPHGVHGDVRVRLLTDDPEKAAACGARLHEWGLPLVRELIALPRRLCVAALNLEARPVVYAKYLKIMHEGTAKDEVRGRMDRGEVSGPRPIAFGYDIVMLDTVEREDVRRFARWYDEKARGAVAAKAPKPASLSDLADAGEIETIDAG